MTSPNWHPAPYRYPPPPARPNSGLAIASLVLGLVGLVVSWFTFGIPSLLALIFGVAGIQQTGHGRRSGRGMAVVGTLLGAVTLLFGLWVSWTFLHGFFSAMTAGS